MRLSRLAKIIAETASLELVANGRAINEIKNAGMLVALEKLCTTSTKGSAKAAAMAVPSIKKSIALINTPLLSSTPSTTSSL